MRLGPGQVQILFAHLQPHLVEGSVTEEPGRIESSANALMRAATRLSIPVTYALVPGGDGAPSPIDPIATFADETNSFVADVAAPFLVDALRQRVDACKRPIMIVCGIATEAAVLHSVIDAIEAEYRVIVPIDAIGSTSDRAERAALDHIGREGGEMMSTATILSMLAPDFRSEPGASMLTLIQSLSQQD
ncbi:isochorismatase family protein [Sphingomonas phyllosphaerae]|uniref:isochorismatase family protein n=1 Tax=Sphingomonas phyllosphaerae TaxID=257003 RepID=UPI00241383A2|nr:isochorismatase family protein [Sphingomonas phyllosphaerae]